MTRTVGLTLALLTFVSLAGCSGSSTSTNEARTGCNLIIVSANDAYSAAGSQVSVGQFAAAASTLRSASTSLQDSLMNIANEHTKVAAAEVVAMMKSNASAIRHGATDDAQSAVTLAKAADVDLRQACQKYGDS